MCKRLTRLTNQCRPTACSDLRHLIIGAVSANLFAIFPQVSQIALTSTAKDDNLSQRSVTPSGPEPADHFHTRRDGLRVMAIAAPVPTWCESRSCTPFMGNSIVTQRVTPRNGANQNPASRPSARRRVRCRVGADFLPERRLPAERHTDSDRSDRITRGVQPFDSKILGAEANALPPMECRGDDRWSQTRGKQQGGYDGAANSSPIAILA